MLLPLSFLLDRPLVWLCRSPPFLCVLTPQLGHSQLLCSARPRGGTCLRSSVCRDEKQACRSFHISQRKCYSDPYCSPSNWDPSSHGVPPPTSVPRMRAGGGAGKGPRVERFATAGSPYQPYPHRQRPRHALDRSGRASLLRASIGHTFTGLGGNKSPRGGPLCNSRAASPSAS